MKKIILVFFVSLLTIINSCQINETYSADNDKEFDNGSNIILPELNERTINDLELLGRLWGFPVIK
ncbi:MAG: hypothetical protein LBQ22_00450 [Bacteroidales bacterium]|jgi:hypothetical protein|nr:hypothetical protein [Bacteroidales bacterium]